MYIYIYIYIYILEYGRTFGNNNKTNRTEPNIRFAGSVRFGRNLTSVRFGWVRGLAGFGSVRFGKVRFCKLCRTSTEPPES